MSDFPMPPKASQIEATALDLLASLGKAVVAIEWVFVAQTVDANGTVRRHTFTPGDEAEDVVLDLLKWTVADLDGATR